MSVKRVETVVLLFPNQEWSTSSEQQLNGDVAQLQPTISFTQHLERENVQTLSSRNADESGEIDGFVYVPDLSREDPCFNVSQQYVPTNVTRQANLPPTDFTLIGVAPWIDVACTKSYLAAARLDPIRALLFYLPNDGSSQPPPISSPLWGLEDGGAWKSETPFPVYAISSDMGAQLIYQSSLYSGNMTGVPHGHEISELPGGDSRDYVRLYSRIYLSHDASWPGVWAFVLVILAALVIMLGFTSATMHLVLRWQRNSLRRRVANGEVNLEILGIKRLTVPPEVITKLPLLTYECKIASPFPSSPDLKKEHQTTISVQYEEGSVDDNDSNSRAPPTQTSGPSDAGVRILKDASLGPEFRNGYQPTCAICLDDFESGVTSIRELPCRHVFHPECIDSFLEHNSSLCPMCKRSVLPIGYCPTRITNSMVRRERNLRAMSSRVNIVSEENGEIYGPTGSYVPSKIKRLIFHPLTVYRTRDFDVALQPQVILMTRVISSEADPLRPILGNELSQDTTRTINRREIAQQRLQELTARQNFVEDTEAVTTRQQPKWRRSLANTFPGF